MISRRLAVSFLLAGVVPVTAQGQSDSVPLARVSVGTPVRVWTQHPPLKKWTLAYGGSTAGSINVAEIPGAEPVEGFSATIPLVEVQRLEAFRGRKQNSRYFFGQTFVGAVIGGFLGGTLGWALDAGLQNPATDRHMGIFLLGGVGIATGAFGGAVAGANGQAVWAPVILPP